MASKRTLTNLTPFKASFNGIMVGAGETVNVPDEWSEPVLKAATGKLFQLTAASKAPSAPKLVEEVLPAQVEAPAPEPVPEPAAPSVPRRSSR